MDFSKLTHQNLNLCTPEPFPCFPSSSSVARSYHSHYKQTDLASKTQTNELFSPIPDTKQILTLTNEQSLQALSPLISLGTESKDISTENDLHKLFPISFLIRLIRICGGVSL